MLHTFILRITLKPDPPVSHDTKNVKNPLDNFQGNLFLC